MKILLLTAFVVMSFARCLAVEGQAFIATKSGENVKLGLVQICLYRRADFVAFIESNKSAGLADEDRMDSLATKASAAGDHNTALFWRTRAVATCHTFFNALPAPLRSTKTDADGKFKLQVPDGEDLIVFARAKRVVAAKDELYLWILPKEEWEEPLFLSNDNLAWFELKDLPEQLGSNQARMKRLGITPRE